MGSLLGEVTEKYDTYNPSPEHQPNMSKNVPRKRAAVGALSGGPAKKLAGQRRAAVPKRKSPVKKAPKKDDKLIIGVDFGTTQVTHPQLYVFTESNVPIRYTGVAYTWSGRPSAYNTIMRWSKDSNGNREKVPSAIVLGSPNVWGSAAVGAEGGLEWFKLLLASEDILPQDVKDSEQLRKVSTRVRELNNSPADVISKYLRAVWEHAIEEMKPRIGADTVDNSKLHIVMTVPAIWTDSMKDKMHQAAFKAGMLKPRPKVGKPILTFIPEPEAAAVAALAEVDGRHDIKPGDTFVVVDCGGGTVDIISYKTARIEPMELSEVVKGQGGLHGAIFVEAQVKALFQDKLLEMSENALDIVSDKELHTLMTDEWEYIREEFTGEQRSWDIRLPMSLVESGIRHPVTRRFLFTLTSSELEEAFRPVVKKIKDLVDGQVEAVRRKEMILPKYIVLVGGFGRCRYLYEYLKEHCDAGVEILQPQQTQVSGPWTAVCHGAVMRGLEKEKVGNPVGVQVRSRIARASYGVVCQEKWDASKHDEEDELWDEEQQMSMSIGQMQWLVKEGDEVTSQQTFSHNFFKLFRERPKELSTTIWKSISAPPSRRKDASVIKHCDVKWNPKIDFDTLERLVNNRGLSFWKLHYITEMSYVGGVMEFRILHDGKKQATKDVSVEFEDAGTLH